MSRASFFQTGQNSPVAKADPQQAMTPLQAKIAAYLAETDVSMRDLSLRVGKNDKLVQTIMDGRSKNPRGDTLSGLAMAMGIQPSELISNSVCPPGRLPARKQEGPLIPVRRNSFGARFQAVRMIHYFPYGEDVAARELGISVEELRAIEMDDASASAELLIRFRDMTGCPIQFLKSSLEDGLPPSLAKWLGYAAPHLMGILGGHSQFLAANNSEKS
jgi:lambda repressor-like predicted transcriptional regulator